MDFLLVILGIGGVVFAGVMLVLAYRVPRLERESDARVERLQTLATGSVLFAEQSPEPAGEVELLNRTTGAHPFVMTVPAGRVAGGFSFERTPGRRT